MPTELLREEWRVRQCRLSTGTVDHLCEVQLRELPIDELGIRNPGENFVLVDQRPDKTSRSSYPTEFEPRRFIEHDLLREVAPRTGCCRCRPRCRPRPDRITAHPSSRASPIAASWRVQENEPAALSRDHRLEIPEHAHTCVLGSLQVSEIEKDPTVPARPQCSDGAGQQVGRLDG